MENDTKKRDELLEIFLLKYEQREKGNRLIAEMSKDPYYALSWYAAGAIEEAAMNHVASIARRILDRAERPFETLLEESKASVVNALKFPHKSTSPISNELSVAVGVAWAELYEKLLMLSSWDK
jgi:hypothetical protein